MNTKLNTTEKECKLSGFENLTQAFIHFASIVQYLILPFFIYECSKRSKKKLVLPRFITFRIYSSEIIGKQIISNCLWQYGIPTHDIYTIVDIEKQNNDCVKFIEIKLAIPSTRHFQADLLLRQWFNSEFIGCVVISKPVTQNNITTLKYAQNRPMQPKGIPFKPVMLYDKILSLLFSNQIKQPKQAKLWKG